MPAAVLQSREKRNAGRPRCQAAREAILAATVRLLAVTTVRDLAIESIAREAGVGKATIYRWWPNKTAIVIDAFFSEAAPLTGFAQAPTALEAIRIQLAKMIEVLSSPLGRIAAQVIGEGQSNADVLVQFREVFLEKRRAEFRSIFERGVRDGEFNPEVDVDLAADLIYGPIWYRLMVGHQPLERALAERLAAAALAGIAASG